MMGGRFVRALREGVQKIWKRIQVSKAKVPFYQNTSFFSLILTNRVTPPLFSSGALSH